MYPNPQDVLPLPPHPDVHQYRKRAKDLTAACRTGGADAVAAWAAQWVTDLLRLQAEQRPEREVAHYTTQLAAYAQKRMDAACTLSEAQLVIARAHGFPSWPKLVHHLDALAGTTSPISAFEEAADAIVTGDVAALEALLQSDPHLIRARSDRAHRATLLHYVAANGVENYRQQTPPNILAVARLLLDAGAEVDAEADMYGGGDTTLLLTVTSAHPRAAGVQNELTDLLLARGARIRPGIVRDCLANGCPEAAAHLVEHGAPLDFEGAAGIGRIDVVAEHFDRAAAVPKAMVSALMMAAWYGQHDVVSYMLAHGVAAGACNERDGEGKTALHIAAYQGDAQLVALLLNAGAPVDARDARWHTSPLVWAMHAWLVDRRQPAEAYPDVVRRLVEAGASVKKEWLDDERLRADSALYALLSARAV